MRFLCFTQFFLPELGGMQVSNSLLVQGLLEAGHSVKLHIFGRTSKTIKEGSFRQVDHPFSATDLLGHIQVANLLIRECRKQRPDLVLLLDEGITRALGMVPYKVRLPVPVISVNSGSTATRRNSHLKGKLNAWFVRRGYAFLHRIFVADATAGELEARHPYLASKIRRLGRPIPPQFFAEPHNPSSWPPASGLPIFMSSGRASPDKGMDLVLHALAELRERHGTEKVEYWCVGGGPELVNWQNLAQKLQLSKVKFFGHVNFFELHKYYAQAHFFILPSRGDMETFGRVWVEALASSKPVISTRLDNLSSIIYDGENGFFVEPSVESIATCVSRCLVLTSSEYLKMSQIAHETALQYSLSHIVEKLIEGANLSAPVQQTNKAEF